MTSPPSQAPLSVLVVDDDPNMQRWASAILQSAGHRVAVAADAMVALMMVRSFHPDVVVLDLGLPAGGGKGFLARLRKLPAYGKIPVVILSGSITPATANDLAPFGVSLLLKKPADPALFLETVRKAVT